MLYMDFAFYLFLSESTFSKNILWKWERNADIIFWNKSYTFH